MRKTLTLTILLLVLVACRREEKPKQPPTSVPPPKATATEPDTLRNRVASTPPNTQVNLTLIRDRREQQMQVTLG